MISFKGSKVITTALCVNRWGTTCDSQFNMKKRELAFKQINNLCVPATIFHWLTNYLSHHSQRIVLNGCCSPWLPVKSGVPQGSILGQLLFLLYQNDIASLPLSHDATIQMFADDIMLCKQISSSSNFLAFQRDIQSVDEQ